MARENLEIVITAKDRASRVLSGISGSLTSIGKVVAGGALAGVAGLGAAFAAVAVPGFQLNNALEQASARIQAFTKDSEETARILDLVKARAAATPFAFQAMANATANLLPVAKSSNIALEELQQTAEILAASNPAQGLEGAAFSLKEALSGDFVSIVERFNLPRKFINDLKEQGVPDLEIVQRAMAQLGLDTSLVTNLAETAQGRWSTFTDTLQGLAANVTGGIFDSFSDGLGGANEALSNAAPMLEEWATGIGQSLGEVAEVIIPGFVEAVTNLLEGDLIGAIVSVGMTLGNVFGPDVGQSFIDFATNALVEWGKFKEGVQGPLEEAKGAFDNLGAATQKVIDLLPDLAGMGDDFQLSEFAIESVKEFAFYMDQIAQGIDAAARAAENFLMLKGQLGEIGNLAGQVPAGDAAGVMFGAATEGFGQQSPSANATDIATGLGAFSDSLFNMFSSAPPAQVDVTVLVDGADVASQINVRQGASAQGEIDMGGRATQ